MGSLTARVEDDDILPRMRRRSLNAPPSARSRREPRGPTRRANCDLQGRSSMTRAWGFLVVMQDEIMSRWLVLSAFVVATTLTGTCRNRDRNNVQPDALPTETTGTGSGSSGTGPPVRGRGQPGRDAGRDDRHEYDGSDARYDGAYGTGTTGAGDYREPGARTTGAGTTGAGTTGAGTAGASTTGAGTTGAGTTAPIRRAR